MTRPTLLRRLLCLANLCGTFITKSDNTGVWGDSVSVLSIFALLKIFMPGL